MGLPSKKYGFFTATAMVVGITIGSGVFKSAGDVLKASGGSLPMAVLAWLIGGLIMVISAYTFSLVATRVERSSGIVDYVEDALGERAGYLVAWFLSFVYYPTLTGILSWLAATITSSMLGFDNPITGGATWLIAVVYMFATYVLGFISPILSGKWQVSTASIKLVPLFLIAVVGLISGLFNGNVVTSFTTPAVGVSGGLATAVAVTVFAYDGWILATTINGELKDAKKTLPKALVVGSLVVVGAYLLFFVGLSGVITNNEAIDLAGSLETSRLAASRLFGSFGNVVSVLILVSVLGTLNGVVMAATRGLHSISIRNLGPKPAFFSELNKGGATFRSGMVSIVFSLGWLFVWYGNFQGFWGGFMDTSVLSIVFLSASYLIVYVHIIRDFTDLNAFNRFVVPTLAGLGSCYLLYGAFMSDPKMFMWFFIVVSIILLTGLQLNKVK